MKKEISAQELKQLMEQKDVHLIDIRDIEEHQAGHVEGCINIPMNELIYRGNFYLNKDETYYLICQSGRRSAMLVDHLLDKGYQVVDVLGGHNEWPE